MWELVPSDFCDAGQENFRRVRRTPDFSRQGRDAICDPLGGLEKGQREIARRLAGGGAVNVSEGPVSVASDGQARWLGPCQFVSRPPRRGLETQEPCGMEAPDRR